MPISRPITFEEDATMSLSTTISGLVAKYSGAGPGQVPAKMLLASVVVNACVGINELIETSNMTFTEKAQIRGDLKTLCNRAFRAKMQVINGGPAVEETEKA